MFNKPFLEIDSTDNLFLASVSSDDEDLLSYDDLDSPRSFASFPLLARTPSIESTSTEESAPITTTTGDDALEPSAEPLYISLPSHPDNVYSNEVSLYEAYPILQVSYPMIKSEPEPAPLIDHMTENTEYHHNFMDTDVELIQVKSEPIDIIPPPSSTILPPLPPVSSSSSSSSDRAPVTRSSRRHQSPSRPSKSHRAHRRSRTSTSIPIPILRPIPEFEFDVEPIEEPCLKSAPRMKRYSMIHDGMVFDWCIAVPRLADVFGELVQNRARVRQYQSSGKSSLFAPKFKRRIGVGLVRNCTQNTNLIQSDALIAILQYRAADPSTPALQQLATNILQELTQRGLHFYFI